VSEERKSNNLKNKVTIFFTTYQHSKVVVYLRLKLRLFDVEFQILKSLIVHRNINTVKEVHQIVTRKFTETK